jgi:hypothetical protein
MVTDPAPAYRIHQDGMIVARAEGQHALREIMHYAAVYREDGPLSIQKRIKRHWRSFGVISDE